MHLSRHGHKEARVSEPNNPSLLELAYRQMRILKRFGLPGSSEVWEVAIAADKDRTAELEKSHSFSCRHGEYTRMACAGCDRAEVAEKRVAELESNLAAEESAFIAMMGERDDALKRMVAEEEHAIRAETRVGAIEAKLAPKNDTPPGGFRFQDRVEELEFILNMTSLAHRADHQKLENFRKAMEHEGFSDHGECIICREVIEKPADHYTGCPIFMILVDTPPSK